MRFPVLSRSSGPLLGAISVIAVGVGLAAMVFALADPVFRKLPYADPDRLVSISFGMPPPGPLASPADVPSLASWQARTDLFEGVAAFLDRGWLRVRLSDRVVPLRAVAVTDNLLEVLGLESRFAESDPAAAWVSSRVASLSGGALQPGRSVSTAPEGVLRVRSLLPPSFLLPQVNRTAPVDVLVALPVGPVIVIKTESASSQSLDLVARLRPGVTPPIVEAALNVSMAPVGRRVSVVPLSMALNARLQGLALGALLASGLVVLVSWTNVFSMAVTRGLYRGAEIATRTALGATPGRIVGLLAGEGLKAAALGSGSALALTWLALTAAVPALPPQFATLGAPSVTPRVVLFVALAGALAGVSWWVASLLAWKLGAQRRALHATSRDGARIRIVRFVLVAGQFGAASVLLVGSALLGRSYLNLLNVDSGLDDRTQALTVAHDPNIPVALRRDVVERTLTALRRAGGIVAAGASADALLDGRTNLRFFVNDGQVTRLDWTYVAGDYFTAMGLQFLAGGPPEPGNADEAVITESTARELFGSSPPIGHVLSYGRDFRIVGVVRDVRARGLSLQPRPGVYAQVGGWGGAQPQTTYVLRVADNAAAVASWERLVRDVDPLVVVLDSGAIGERLDRSVRDRTFATLVVGLFALASLLVAALGLAGVVAYTVVKRTREIAIRLALGATGEGVTTLAVRDALTAATCGVVAGVIASVWLSRALESLLYGIPAADPTTLLLTAASLLGVVLGAAMLPAIRAAHIAPATALRIE
jgi:putative ABC transport system permease protein